MREIRFRAWDKKDGKMFEVKRINFSDKTIHYASTQYLWKVKFEDVELMQYIGQKDKSEIEIYVGDVLEIPDDYETYGQFAGDKREVIFAYGGFRLKPKWDVNAKGNYLEDAGELRVLGNIYENPELLK